MQATLKSYVIGFVSSVVLTLAAFSLVMYPGFFHASYGVLVPAIILLAIAQLFVQLIFFMHLASESELRWKLAAFISTVGIVLIVVVGSIWIMNHLNYNMMASPADMNAYIQSQDGF
ncbi:MAG TPA: cytochrome o ubiquinol oxidase subunit IV [Candidatus Paceibacterota bacterium]|nr:cytochrome o ubiquinol oxidase subunit IV [Candidatus Paceibacterota bacterium]